MNGTKTGASHSLSIEVSLCLGSNPGLPRVSYLCLTTDSQFFVEIVCFYVKLILINEILINNTSYINL